MVNNATQKYECEILLLTWTSRNGFSWPFIVYTWTCFYWRWQIYHSIVFWAAKTARYAKVSNSTCRQSISWFNGAISATTTTSYEEWKICWNYLYMIFANARQCRNILPYKIVGKELSCFNTTKILSKTFVISDQKHPAESSFTCTHVKIMIFYLMCNLICHDSNKLFLKRDMQTEGRSDIRTNR